MRKRYVGLLLVGMLGCTQEDGTLPSSVTITNAGRYRLADQVVSCQASATSGYILSSTDSTESISVDLTAIAAPSPNSSPYLSLDFHRSASQPGAPYELELVMYLDGDNNTPPEFPDNVVATLHEMSPGVVSGTFSTNKPGQYSFSEGSFTNVHVRPPGN